MNGFIAIIMISIIFGIIMGIKMFFILKKEAKEADEPYEELDK